MQRLIYGEGLHYPEWAFYSSNKSALFIDIVVIKNCTSVYVLSETSDTSDDRSNDRECFEKIDCIFFLFCSYHFKCAYPEKSSTLKSLNFFQSINCSIFLSVHHSIV